MPTRFALFELGIFLAVVLLEWLWEPFPDFTRLNPHPYWLPVLLLSLQYGTVSGLLAAAIAIGGSVLIGLAEPDIGESYFNYLVRVWSQPVLWLVVALLLGSFRMRQIEHRNDLEGEVSELRARGLALVDHANNLRARCDTLERNLSAKPRPETDRLLSALADLDRADEATWRASMTAALDVVTPGAEASVFLSEGDGMKLLHSHRWSRDARWRREIMSSEPLAHAILGEARTLSVLSAADEAALAGEGVIAVPIAHPASHAVIGMIKIETPGSGGLDGGLVDRLGIVSLHFGRALHAKASLAGRPAMRSVHSAPNERLPRLRLWSLIRGDREAEPRDDGAEARKSTGR